MSRRSFPGEPTARAALIDHDENANQTMSPDYGWLNVDIASTHFNVVDGTRVTRSPPGEPEATVWMFGGSTTYGFGQRDEHTIASALVAEAESHGRSVEVVNRGVNAYVNAQETDVFEDLLASGERPDVAVFLDGCNENALGFERERYGLLDTDETYTLASTTELQDERAEAARRAGWEETHDLDRQAELAAPQYARGVRRARAVAEEYGVAAVHFWQPMFVNLHRDDPMVPTVAHNLEVGLDFMALSRESYARARKLSGVDPIDISDSLAGASVPTFFDFCHTNEAGARLEAEAMWPHVEAFLPRA